MGVEGCALRRAVRTWEAGGWPRPVLEGAPGCGCDCYFEGNCLGEAVARAVLAPLPVIWACGEHGVLATEMNVWVSNTMAATPG